MGFVILSPLSYALMALLMSMAGAGAVLTTVQWASRLIEMHRVKQSDRRDAAILAERDEEARIIEQVSELPREWQIWAYDNAASWGLISAERRAVLFNPALALFLDHFESIICE
jgi:hypothetical protein